jgi:hypothetical protein
MSKKWKWILAVTGGLGTLLLACSALACVGVALCRYDGLDTARL